VWWKRNVRMGRQEGSVLRGDLYYEIRYEALVEDPVDECRKLCGFIDIPYDSAMLRFHEGRTIPEPGLSAKESWLPITPGLRDWRAQMKPADLEVFEAASGDLLSELNYPRVFPNPSPEKLKEAARIYQLFVADLQSNHQRLPAGW